VTISFGPELPQEIQMPNHCKAVSCACAAVLLASSTAAAQVSGAQNTQAVNSEVLALRTSADLVVRDLGFTALAEVTFTLVNRGDVGINVPAVSGTLKASGRQPPAGPPIQIEIVIGTAKITVQQPVLAGRQSKTLTVPLPSNIVKPKCLDTRSLTVKVDPQNVVTELHDDNNETTVSAAARPCPDLAVVSIERDKEGALGETYRARVKIINQGNAPSPPTKVWGTALSTAPGITGWPEFSPTHDLKALQPGETASFKIGGSVFSFDNSWVRIILDRFFDIEESNEGNNFKEKKL
jgi:hypothetical protein